MSEPRRIGDYEIEAKLGSGGMGVVFRAHHKDLPGRPVAIKVLLADAPNPEVAARFRREMETLAKATAHPGVVRILGGSFEGARPYYVMELIEGQPLSVLAKDGLPKERAARLLRQVSDTVSHLHALGIVHRDLKPENVLVDDDDRARVCDFGVASLAGAVRLTRTGAIVGTPFYAAPEQLAGAPSSVDARADVYALGGLLFHALVGRPPFEAESLVELFAKVSNVGPDPPSRHAPGVPPALDALCLHALAKEPGERPSAAAFRDGLDAFLRGERAGGPSRLGVARRLSRRRDLRVLGVAALVVVLVVAATAVVQKTLAGRRLHEGAAEANAAFLEAMSDLAPAARIAALLPAIQDEERRATVERRLAERRYADAAARSGRRSQDLVALVDLALAAIESASLVGEKTGVALELGDALLDETPPLVDAALRLAEARLAAEPGAPAARALRAYATLAAAGAPRRPLGPGALGVAQVTSTVLHDLEAASSLPGPPGARAVWLRVDLLLSDGPDKYAAARRVHYEAARLAPDAPERAALERVLGLPLDAKGYSSLVARLRTTPPDPTAGEELGRFFARLGEPTVARADPAPVELRRDESIPQDLAHIYGTTRNLLTLFSPEDTEAKRPRIVAQLKRLLAGAPLDHRVLNLSGSKLFARLTRGVFLVLEDRFEGASGAVVPTFSRADRIRSRALREGYGPRWETDLEGEAACREFDARLDEDCAQDELFRVLRRHAPEEPVALAVRATRGLRRLEELVSHPELPPAERDRLAFDGLVGLQALRRLGCCRAAVFRARLRAIAFPGELGATLAAHDLGRVARSVPGATANSWTLFLSAADAARDLETPERDRLAVLAQHFAREVAVRDGRTRLDAGGTVAEAREVLESTLRNVGLEVGRVRPGFDLRPTPEEVARLGAPFVLRAPPRDVGVK